MNPYKFFVMFVAMLLLWLNAASLAFAQQSAINMRDRTAEEKEKAQKLKLKYETGFGVTPPKALPAENQQINKEKWQRVRQMYDEMEAKAKAAGGKVERESVYAHLRREIVKQSTPISGKQLVAALDQAEQKFDWRDARLGWKVVTPIRDQGACQTCWTFAAVAALESNYRIRYSQTQFTVTNQKNQILEDPDKEPSNFSEQELINRISKGKRCKAQDNDVPTAFNFMMKPGIPREAGKKNVEYTGTPGPFDPNRKLHQVLTWGYVFNDPEKLVPTTKAQIQTLKEALLEHGPLAVMMAVDEDLAFQDYPGGVYETESKTGVNHWVLLVGWDERDATKPVWIIKNSYGTDWGEKGFMRIKMGVSKIGVQATWVEAPLDFDKQDP